MREGQIDENIPAELENLYTDLWGSSKEPVKLIDISMLVPFKDDDGNEQPYKINSNKVRQIEISAKEKGIVTPLIVRRQDDCTYQIISGHNRMLAAKNIGMLSVPCIIKELNDDEAYEYMAETNIQRGNPLPSELGKIFKKYFDINANRVKNKIEILNELTMKFDCSEKTIYRYINITKLVQPLQKMVDDERIHIGAVDLISSLSLDQQIEISNFMRNKADAKIAPSTARKLKSLSEQKNDFTETDIINMLMETSQNRHYNNKLYNKLAERFPECKEYSESELDALFISLYEKYKKEN